MTMAYAQPAPDQIRNLLRLNTGPSYGLDLPAAPVATTTSAASLSAGGMPAKSPCSAPFMDVAFKVLAPADARNYLIFGAVFMLAYLFWPDSRSDETKKEETGQLVNSHIVWIVKLAIGAYILVSFLFHCRYP